ncbi:MAG: OmpA family protein [Gammaproteobacteria bacterium]
MQLAQFKLKPIRTLGVFLTCGVLIAGCAGNTVKPTNQDTGPITTSQLDKGQMDNDASTPVAQTPSTDNSMASGDTTATAVQSDTDSTAADNSNNVSETDMTTEQPASQASATPLEPAQTTFYFGINQARLNDQDKTVLQQHASFLKANPTLVLEINGHTDSTGKHAYNEYLSKQRAEAVAKILINDGVKRSQLVINALADSKPLSDQSDPGKNRRVELQYDDMNMVSSK